MEVLKEMGLIALILLAVFLTVNIIIHIYWKWRLRQYNKASADYQSRGVEEHQAKMRKESESDSSSSD